MTEQQIQKKIIDKLETNYDAYVVKVQTASKAGVPDIICCISGMFLGIEVKTPKSRNNLSKLQEYNLRQIIRADGNCLVAWNVEMVEEYVEAFIL